MSIDHEPVARKASDFSTLKKILGNNSHAEFQSSQGKVTPRFTLPQLLAEYGNSTSEK
jgi:hypothetical protein